MMKQNIIISNEHSLKLQLSEIGSFKDNKLDDAVRVFDFLNNYPSSDVAIDKFKAHYGGESLRVDPILFQMEQEGLVEITSRGHFGAPQRCRLKR